MSDIQELIHNTVVHAQEAATKHERERIVSIIEGLKPSRSLYEMPMNYWIERRLVKKLLSLIDKSTS